MHFDTTAYVIMYILTLEAKFNNKQSLIIKVLFVQIQEFGGNTVGVKMKQIHFKRRSGFNGRLFTV